MVESHALKPCFQQIFSINYCFTSLRFEFLIPIVSAREDRRKNKRRAVSDTERATKYCDTKMTKKQKYKIEFSYQRFLSFWKG